MINLFRFRLPLWAKYTGSELVLKNAINHEFQKVPCILVKYQDAYPYFIRLYQLVQLDQYWYEVIRRTITAELQLIIKQPFKLILDSGVEKEQWRIGNFLIGKGAQAGAENYRQHYNQLKGKL